MTVTAAGLESTGIAIVENIIDHEGSINMIAGMVGILPEVAFAEKFLPMIVGALKFMQEETGKSMAEVASDLMNHISPNGPLSPVLSPPGTPTAEVSASTQGSG
jgi:hypothetical protein